jgi:radical SAM protein with 4Fe4S-binding SPASM domain
MTKYLCVLPWIHLNIEPSGSVRPCCMMTDQNYIAGNLNKQTVEEIWNDEPLRKLRREMLAGEKPVACTKCWRSEDATGLSNRVHNNKNFSSKLAEIPVITDSTGYTDKIDLRYWDFRFSNLCNYKCRSCGPHFSSAWIPDADKLGYLPEEFKNKKVFQVKEVDEGTNVDFLEKYIDIVEHIYFAGGEPLLMDEHYKILDMLVAKNRFDVIIKYNTNISTFTHKKYNVLDYWDKWGQNLQLWPSIDEIGERAELIRSGTNWNNVEANLKTLVEKKYNVRPGITVGAWNVFRLPEIIQYLTDIGIIRPQHRNFYFNMLLNPSHYHMHILSDEHKAEISAKLRKFVKEYNDRYQTNILPDFEYVLSELNVPHDPIMAKKFVYVSQAVDGIRDENIYNVIPELNYIKEKYGNP